jgi:hypothetical protein
VSGFQMADDRFDAGATLHLAAALISVNNSPIPESGYVNAVVLSTMFDALQPCVHVQGRVDEKITRKHIPAHTWCAFVPKLGNR